MFWEMFCTFTQEERQMYLKFVWGRDKLPLDCANLRDKHKIEVKRYANKDSHPQAHTCYFTIDVPEYQSLQIMTAKIKMAMELCGEIDTDGRAEEIDEY